MPRARGTALDQPLVEVVEAAAHLASATTVGEALDRLTASAARLIGARVAVTEVEAGSQGIRWSAHLEPPHDQHRELLAPPPTWLTELVDSEGGDVRLSADVVAASRRSADPPLGAVIATNLSSADGELTGRILLADPTAGTEFSAQDESVLRSLGALAVVTIEKAELAASHARRDAARFRDEMLAGMSHDMHTPLSVIVGIADSLTEDPDLPRAERIEVYATVARQARRLRSLVNQFIDFSRIEADRPLTLDLHPLNVVEVIDHVVPLFTHQREIIVGADEDLPEALADQERLEQVLVNLISNAVKYSDGPVRVVARGVSPDIIVDVVDEGPGLSDEELTEIFGKFRRGTAASGTRGTGLGLYISRALAEAQGGELHAMSAGMGSRFRVRLPMAPGP